MRKLALALLLCGCGRPTQTVIDGPGTWAELITFTNPLTGQNWLVAGEPRTTFYCSEVSSPNVCEITNDDLLSLIALFDADHRAAYLDDLGPDCPNPTSSDCGWATATSIVLQYDSIGVRPLPTMGFPFDTRKQHQPVTDQAIAQLTAFGNEKCCPE